MACCSSWNLAEAIIEWSMFKDGVEVVRPRVEVINHFVFSTDAAEK